MVLLLARWQDARLPIPPTPITASVIAHDVHRSLDCTRVVLRDNGTIEGMCWGAHITYAWANGTRTCTISDVLQNTHSKGGAESILKKSHALGAIRNMFIHHGGNCLLQAPPLHGDTLRRITYPVNIGLIIFFALWVFIILWEWYGAAVMAWFHRHGLLLPYGSEGGGGDGANKKTDEPLIASAPLP